jgi:hypothetical protein
MSPHVVRTLKSEMLQWTGHVTRIGQTKNAYRVRFQGLMATSVKFSFLGCSAL